MRLELGLVDYFPLSDGFRPAFENLSEWSQSNMTVGSLLKEWYIAVLNKLPDNNTKVFIKGFILVTHTKFCIKGFTLISKFKGCAF